jgi:hypothetical protein
MNLLRIATNTTRRTFPVFFAIILFSAMSVSVCAKNDSSGAISATITLSTPAKIGNTQLAAGEYKITAEGNQAKIEQGKKVIAQVPCTLKDLSFKPKATGFDLDKGAISEIQVEGKTKAIEFSAAPTTGN